jgi:serine/threonine protein kinase
MDYCPGGELFNLLNKKEKLSEEETKFYVANIVLAFEELHTQDIIYRDLKPENLLIDADGYLKVTDFGLSLDKIDGQRKRAKSFCGTAEYLSPEIVETRTYGKANDWWQLGNLIYELLSGRCPFSSFPYNNQNQY